MHVFELEDAAVATSGIGRRSWLGVDGRPAHHLLDPATGRPAFTGIVQATALAPTAVEAEWRAKAAVLSGPERAADWLEHGGVVVLDDRTHFVIEPTNLRGERHDMNKRGFRRVAVFASAATLAGSAIAGCGSAASNTSSGAGTSQQQTGQPPQGGGGMDVSALADALGVTEAKLQAAMQKSMPQPGEQGSGNRR